MPRMRNNKNYVWWLYCVDVYRSVFDMWSCLEWSAFYIHNNNNNNGSRKYRYLYIKCNTQRSKQKYPSSKGEGIEWEETKQEKSDTAINKELRKKETHTQHPQYRTNLTPFAALCEKCLTIVIGSAFGNNLLCSYIFIQFAWIVRFLSFSHRSFYRMLALAQSRS